MINTDLGEDVPASKRMVAALLGWLVPGTGHLYLGRRFKGIAYTIIINCIFMSGWVMSHGEAMSLYEDDGHRYAFVAQIGAGGPTALSLLITHRNDNAEESAEDAKERRKEYYKTDEYVARLPWSDTGLLYTMVAGLLNMLVVFEAFTGGQGIVPDLEKEQQKAQESQSSSEASSSGPDPTTT